MSSLCLCSSEPIHVSNNKKRSIVRAKCFHANITIFEKDNQSCLFCFTAFTSSAIQVFIMKQDGVWNILCERGGEKSQNRSGTKHQQNWFQLAGMLSGLQYILCVLMDCSVPLLGLLQSMTVRFRRWTKWNLNVNVTFYVH